MRYIGGKSQLLSGLDAVVSENVPGGGGLFCDIFAGTGSVARHFKPRFQVISNDILHFSYVIQKATVEANAPPPFDGLRAAGIEDPVAYLETADTDLAVRCPFFITNNYAPDFDRPVPLDDEDEGTLLSWDGGTAWRPDRSGRGGGVHSSLLWIGPETAASGGPLLGPDGSPARGGCGPGLILGPDGRPVAGKCGRQASGAPGAGDGGRRSRNACGPGGFGSGEGSCGVPVSCAADDPRAFRGD
ncbi:MAG: DNA adenine methylase, partial [Deltaproteobacteria bacterium]|nr:DNA adenine methylase [Deltaproteobacteria bacterium]